ncbi:ABC transporter permease [Clostridium felsineum]|uniref:Oligopeptide transport system permease protein OppC n=1 Tax=Clostridium felsineum TaxID=36839 RepID=A0A1S8L638_9CLOT|nr:ABC transporter permease [Clostridium felsineum]URZ08744.1 Oligopeptide transport system permease protein OppC [Clostridium felsineum]URZ09372.1 Oligopeptide transport system permease protein OppC [Clostridium felsineum]
MAENSSEKFKIIGCENNNSEEIVRKNVTYWQDAWRRLKQNKVAVISLALLIVIILLAIIGPMLRPFTTNDVNDSIKNIGSNSTHWLGTDDLGRDLWVRLWVGTRSSIIIGIVGAAIELVIGALYGGISGYFGGIVDDIMMRIIEILNSIPYLILVLIVIIVLNSTGIIPLIIGMTLTGWVGMARIVRGQVLSIKEQEYVLAAKTLGAGSTRIIMKHLLPNVIGVMIVDVTFAVPNYIFAEAFLSYIGLGVKPPSTSLGALCSSGQSNLMFYPYQLFWPSLIICLIMLTFNLLGDGLSEALDPKQRQ